MDKLIDSYYTIASATSGDYREKGSKFLSYAYCVKNIKQVESALESVRGLHPKARHFCYAYKLGIDGQQHRANDDGEPSGTAGRPILGQLHSYQLSDCLIVVVRYFGGTKLGASGLINAYRTAAHLALEQADKREVIIGSDFKLTFTYGEMGHVLNVLKGLQLEMVKKDFGAIPSVQIRVRASEIQTSLIQLKAQLLNISTDQITEQTIVDFCTIELIE